jgi:hypothetical protein
MHNRKIGHFCFLVLTVLASSAQASVSFAQSADRPWMSTNLSPEERGAPHTFVVQLDHFTTAHTATTLYRVGSTHGNSLALFDQMGRPKNLSTEQIARLQRAGSMAPAEPVSIRDGRITTTVPPYGLVVLLIRHQ